MNYITVQMDNGDFYEFYVSDDKVEDVLSTARRAQMMSHGEDLSADISNEGFATTEEVDEFATLMKNFTFRKN